MKKLKAFSLIELLLAITLFSALVIVVGTIVIESYRTIKNNELKSLAIYKIKEITNAISVIKNDMWSNIVVNSGNGFKHLEFSNNQYLILDGSVEQDGILFELTIDEVERDINGNIVVSGGTVDPHTRRINISGSWADLLGAANEITSEYYINDWNTSEWLVTTQSEFEAGSFDNTYAANERGGEITLQALFYPDWCKPNLQYHTYDIPGNAYAKSIYGLAGRGFLGTNGNASGVAFTDVEITGVDDPLVSIRGEWNSFTTNDIFVSGNYAYLATKHPTNEVAILDISTLPYVQVGSFNAPTSKAANSIFVQGNLGFVAIERYVYIFDLTSKTGSRPLLGSLKVSLNENWGKTAYVSKILVNNNYLYAALIEDWYELVIVDVTNPASMVITSQTSVNNQQTGDIQIRSDGSRVYFSTDSSDVDREFFIIDTSVKTGARPIISSYDTNGMSINGIAIVEIDNKAILVGENGQEYQVVNILDEQNLNSCGGMELNLGIFDVSAVIDAQGNTFTYLVTNDPVNDFQIIRGGAGGGGGQNGYGFTPTGTYESSVLDTNSSSTYYFYLTFDSIIPVNNDLKLQARTGNSLDLTSESWLGPDGTTGSYFTANGISTFANIFQNKRYIQFKAYFTSDTINTSELELVRLNYQK